MFGRIGTYVCNWYDIWITRRKRRSEIVDDFDEVDEEVPRKRARPNSQMSEQFLIKEPDELSYSMSTWLTPGVSFSTRKSKLTRNTLTSHPRTSASIETNKENHESGVSLKRTMANSSETIDLTEEEVVLVESRTQQRSARKTSTGAYRKVPNDSTRSHRKPPVNVSGDYRKPPVDVSGDEDVQIIEPDPKIVHTFASNPFSIPKRASVSQDRSYNSANLTINTVNRMDERKQFAQLISMYEQDVPWRAVSRQIKSSPARQACSKIRDIPLVHIDNGVEVIRTNEAVPSTLATKLASQEIRGQMKKERGPARNVITGSHYFNTKSLAKDINAKYLERQRQSLESVKETRRRASLFKEQNDKSVEQIEGRLRQFFTLTETILVDEIEEEPKLPVLTEDMAMKINKALVPSPSGQVLVEAFNLSISRHDMQTLNKLNWLNDEVINFYMSMLNDRSNQGEYLKVYAFNTFFYPKLLSGGHAVLKRWTKKIDIFAKELVVVPVHLGVHWCLAIIDFRKKQIQYYDSMGNPNNKCLEHLRMYIEAESKDKKKQAYDTRDWKLVNVAEIPQQMNGSDCGMFSCMFAEYLCRDAKISFTQNDMPYFRRKMVYEILTTKLLPFQ